MIEFFWAYLVIGILWFVVSVLLMGMLRLMAFEDHDPGMKGLGRAIFLTPIWPLVVLYVIYLGLRSAWRAADFGGEK